MITTTAAHHRSMLLPLTLALALLGVAGCASSGDTTVAGGGGAAGDGAGSSGAPSGGTDTDTGTPGAGTDTGTPAAPPSSPGSPQRLFAPYIDMSLAPAQQLLAIQQRSGIRVFTLAFVVDDGSCKASWGGLGQTLPADAHWNGTTIKSLVEGIRQAGGDVIVSFGGAVGADVGPGCRTAAEVQAMFQSVVDRYGVTMVDFDIEGYTASRQPAVDLRNEAVKGLKAANPGLVVSYTLPVLPTGLVDAGLGILAAVRSSGLDLDVVNVMAMDYGAGFDNGGKMGVSAIQAATATEAQVRQAGLSSSIGVVPMIGVNDVASEIFTLDDAQQLLEWARATPWVSRLSMWSVTRDSGSCPGQTWASPTCSGVAQADAAFARLLAGF
jgi:hypothetical protein